MSQDGALTIAQSFSVYLFYLNTYSCSEMFDKLCECGAYSESDAARLIREVASALAFIHGIGIVHGDLKVRGSGLCVVGFLWFDESRL